MNIIKHRAIHESNFTVIHNELLKNSNLSLEAIGLLLRILSLPKDWKLTIKGLAIISHCGDQKITRILNELQNEGFLKKTQIRQDNKINGFIYEVFETKNPELLSEVDEDSIITKNFLYPDFQDLENEDLENEDLENDSQYNIINNKELYITKNDNNKISKNLENNCVPKIIKNNTCLHDTCNLMDLTLQKQLNKNNELEDAKVAKKGKKKSTQIKNKLEQNPIQEKPINEILDVKLSQQTEDQKRMARLTKRMDELEARERDEKLKIQKQEIRMTKKKRFANKVQSLEMDYVLKDLFAKYISMWISTGKPMTDEIFDAQYNKLFKLSQNLEEQRKIVERSIEKGYTDLYSLTNNWKQENKPELIIQDDYEYDDGDELATDENGNILTF